VCSKTCSLFLFAIDHAIVFECESNDFWAAGGVVIPCGGDTSVYESCCDVGVVCVCQDRVLIVLIVTSEVISVHVVVACCWLDSVDHFVSVVVPVD